MSTMKTSKLTSFEVLIMNYLRDKGGSSLTVEQVRVFANLKSTTEVDMMLRNDQMQGTFGRYVLDSEIVQLTLERLVDMGYAGKRSGDGKFDEDHYYAL